MRKPYAERQDLSKRSGNRCGKAATVAARLVFGPIMCGRVTVKTTLLGLMASFVARRADSDGLENARSPDETVKVHLSIGPRLA